MIIVGSSLPSFLAGFGTTKVYSGVGADIVVESLTPTIKVNECNRDVTTGIVVSDLSESRHAVVVLPMKIVSRCRERGEMGIHWAPFFEVKKEIPAKLEAMHFAISILAVACTAVLAGHAYMLKAEMR